jgi:hypothetical protein
MSGYWQRRVGTGILLLAVGVAAGHAGQLEGLSVNVRYNAGQSVQPIFEGWSRNSDGSFSMHFGYLNRNYVQELHAPVGPGNRLEPGAADQGQPTYFYPRFNRHVFSVAVPKDWGKKELTWTVTSNGRTERAVAWLQPEWEINAPGRDDEGEDSAGRNEPPRIGDVDVSSALVALSTGTTVTLTATAIDDGLPPPRKRQRGGNSENPPAFRPETGLETPTNLPQLERPRNPWAPGRLTMSWIVWRGPAGVVFDPTNVIVKKEDGGKALVKATFTTPGEYVLRARVHDGALMAYQDVKVTVRP